MTKKSSNSKPQVTEQSIVLELQSLVNEDPPNVDAILRKTGQYNRVRGRHIKLAIITALKQKGTKDIDALLDRNG